MSKIFKKLEKNCAKSINLHVFSERLFVSSWKRGRGGGAPRADGGGVNSGVLGGGVTERGGGGWGQ